MTGGLLNLVSWHVFWPFVVTCLVIELTPGPNMAYLAVLSLSKGRRAGLFAVAGVALGLAIVGIAAALGLAALLASSPIAYQVLRWAGIAYLLWLAWETWRDGASTVDTAIDGDSSDVGYFGKGLLTNLLNPKAAMFYVAILPLHIDFSRPVVGQSITLSLIYVAVATVIHGGIVLLASAIRPLLASAVESRAVHAAFALMLVAVAIWFAVGTAR